MNNKREAECLSALKQGLNREANNLEPNVQIRLQQIRQQSVYTFNTDSTVKKRLDFNQWLSNFLAPKAVRLAMLSSLLLTVVLVLALQGNSSIWPEKSLDTLPTPSNNSKDVLMSNEDIEFLENMDIYEWLAAEYG